VVSVGIGFTLQLVAQRYTSAPAAALILSLESVFAAGFGWGLLGETLALTGMIGCGLIFLAIIIAEVVPETALTKWVPRQFVAFRRKD
jgi:drug/metabolite transporter (DMT)-like permease